MSKEAKLIQLRKLQKLDQIRQLRAQAQQPAEQMQEVAPPASLTNSAHEWPAPESGPVDEASIMAAVEDAGSAPRPESVAAQQSREAIASGGLKTIAPQVTGQHLVSNVNKMIADTLNLGPLAYAAATNTAPRSVYEIPFVKGATTSPIPKGAIPMADAVGTATQWGSGGLLSKAPIAATGLTDALMAGGAGIGELVAGETGGTVGGFTGMAVAAANALRGKFSGAPTLSGEEKALKFIEEQTADPQAAAEALNRNISEGNIGTILDMTEDAGMTGVEAMAQSPRNLKLFQQSTDAGNQRAVEQMQAPFGTETTEQAVNTAKGLTKARLGRADEIARVEDAQTARTAEAGLAQTRAAANKAERSIAQTAEAAEAAGQQQIGAKSAVAPTEVSTSSSKRAHEVIDAANTKYKKEIEDPAWDTFRKGGTVPAKEIKDALIAEVANMPLIAVKDMKDAAPKLFKHINNWKGDVDASEVDYVRRKFSDLINQNDHFGEIEKRWASMADVMDSALTTGSRGAEYRAAIDATKGRHEKFSQGAVAKNMRQQAKAPTSFLAKFPFAGDEGLAAASSLKATGEPEAINAVKDHFRSRAKNATIDEKFLDNNQGFLSQFPDLQAEYTTLAQSGGKADAAQGLAKSTAQQQGKVVSQQTTEASSIAKQKEAGLAKTREQAAARKAKATSDVVGRYANDPKATIDKLLSETSDTSLAELAKLRGVMKGRGAEESLKASARESLTSKITSANSGVPELKGAAIDDAVKVAERLDKSGILSPEELAKMMKPINRKAMIRRKRRGTSKIQEVGEGGGKSGELLANVSTMGVMPFIPSGNHTLMVTGSVKRFFKKRFSGTEYDQKAIDRLGDFIADPSLYADVKNAKTAKEANEIMDQSFKLYEDRRFHTPSQGTKAGLTSARELNSEE